MNVPIDRVSSFASSLGIIGVATREGVYLCGRATLVSRPEDFELFDACFATWWLSKRSVPIPSSSQELKVAIELDQEGEDEGDSGQGDDREFEPDVTIRLRYSDKEVLRDKDFAKCSSDELEEAARAMEKIALVVPRRRNSRKIPSGASRGSLDIRRSIKEAMSHHGEPIRIRHKVPGARPRRIILLCDISGSMEPYARSLIRFLHTAVAGGVRVEAFTFSTNLTRITRELNWKDPDVAISRASASVKDWSGGTRIGETLGQFNQLFGVRGMARRAVVVIMSDGWDRGDPDVLAAEMGRLKRVTWKIIWVNPLKYTPGYAPLARGMASALPFVDEFVEGHSLGSLERLAEVISN